MNTENLISMAKTIAKPYKILSYILAILLLLSLAGNVYLATIETSVILESQDNISSVINQTNK